MNQELSRAAELLTANTTALSDRCQEAATTLPALLVDVRWLITGALIAALAPIRSPRRGLLTICQQCRMA
jgi:hypothetical protein